MPIKIKSECYVPASGTNAAETRTQCYLDSAGLKRRETRAIASQSDTTDYLEYRDSDDNGRTWGEWIRKEKTCKVWIGSDQKEEYGYPMDQNVWNPVHRHFVSLRSLSIFSGGYDATRPIYWGGGQGGYYRGYIDVKDASDALIVRQPILYEDGPVYDEETYRETDALERNFAHPLGMWILENGDIIFGVEVRAVDAARLLGVDVNDVFPSVPLHPNAALVCRGTWNNEASRYDLTYSNPILLDDRVSSRGISEPKFTELKSGKILLVFRGANCCIEQWHSRISPYAPAYKWYCLSDDGGKSFSPPMPWHFDTREVIYSSSTDHNFLRSTKNGKLYWIGNITDPTKSDGNWPRYPLQIVEVDEEWGCAKKDTLTVIDTCREGETEQVQLSNFCMLDDRETGDVELYLTKIGQFPDRNKYDCEAWKYTITLPR